MQNFNKMILLVLFGLTVFLGLYGSKAKAQQVASGFALDRFYSSAPGGGWLVMDTLDMHGELGGAMALTLNYASHPLRIGGLSVVSQEASEDFGLAVTYDRYRFYFNLPSPVLMRGDSGTVGDYSFTGPNIDWGTQPDTISDFRLGFDTRLLGDAESPFRLGFGAQLYVPSGTSPEGDRANYDSDGTYRGMARLLVAGDMGGFIYAGQIGIHLRQLNDDPVPQSPQGNELLAGLAAGEKFVVEGGKKAFILGVEAYEESAFRSLMSSNATALEWLLSGRLEGIADHGRQMRLKVGAGAGVDPKFGAPEWRAIVSVELFDNNIFGDQIIRPSEVTK